MSDIENKLLGTIHLFDYRCFQRDNPAAFEVRKGLTSYIGTNNSGKSTIIRIPYELRDILNRLTTLKISPLSVLTHEQGWNTNQPFNDNASIISWRKNPQCKIEIEIPKKETTDIDFIQKIGLEFSPDTGNFKVHLFSENGVNINPIQTSSANSSNNKISINGGPYYNISQILDFIEILSNAQYLGPFRNSINEGGGVYFDTHVGTGFISLWDSWKTGTDIKKNQKAISVTEDIKRLIGARTLDINSANGSNTLQITINGQSKKLQELGAGISQIIIALASALIREPSLIIIDEPELHLHPGLQVEFINTLASYSKYGLVYASHSIGLARMADKCFTVESKDGISKIRDFQKNRNYTEFLGSLGIAGLQEQGWNKILLVEGPHDVRTFQYFLRAYEKDRTTVILPLGGNSMINGKIGHELSEIKRLANGGKIAAIIDSERESKDGSPKKEHKDFSEICRNLDIPCCITEKRAVENYLTQHALDLEYPKIYRQLEAFDHSSEAKWGKGESWRVARHMTIEDLDKTDIGLFLKNF